tara:strand:- start:3083 stop:3652 length:570 start_codon:yes stop_codon:yes gene_type:complete
MLSKLKRAAFLDRDGVINIDNGYVHKWEDFEFCDGAIEGMKNLLSLNFKIIIITNQSGIARGIFTEKEYKKLTETYVKQLGMEGITITSIYHCPHHPLFSPFPYNQCGCRKPNPGLFIKAIRKFKFSLSYSIAIGDNERDLEAAKRAGIKNRFLINNGNKKILNDSEISVHKSLLNCSKYIKNQFPLSI